MSRSDNHHALAFDRRFPATRSFVGVRATRGYLDGFASQDLFAFDKGYYGGLAVVDALAERADQIGHAADAASMWRGIAAQSVQGLASQQQMLRKIGFRHVAVDHLTAVWGGILEERFAMY